MKSALDAFKLDGKVVVVTGGTGTLGSAMCMGLAQAGATVGIMGRRAEIAESLASKIIESGGSALALPADVMDRDSLERACSRVLDAHGRVDVLVNAAGGNQSGATIKPELVEVCLG